MDRPTVILGILGTTLDAPAGPGRWERWRPTVSIFEHEDRAFARLELLHPTAALPMAERVADDVRALSPETEVALHRFDLKDPWDFEEVYSLLHDFFRVYPFRPDDEDYLVHITTGSHVAQICLFLLVESRLVPARLLQTGPPARGKPAVLSVIDLDLARYDRLASRFAAARREGVGVLTSGIETRNAAFTRLMVRMEQVAGTTRAPILLTGPTGAGKSAMARRIYELKRARHLVEGPLVEVNCATLRGDTAMSTLFGHTRGAFTGADRARQGLLLAADGGCLFLDEIGELGADEQAMLLRAIEEKRFLPVGADREVESRFQLVAGTNRSLGDAVVAGRFREDLLARIDLWTFRLPGLAERREDIEPNLEFELERWRAASGRHVRFNREGRARFLAFATSGEARWSANFRDLNAAVTRMATLAPGDRIDVDTVEEEIGRLQAAWGTAGVAAGAAAKSRVERLFGATEIDRFDRVQLEDVLAVCADAESLSDAGRVLFAASRARKTSVNDADRLRKYLARFGLSWADVKGE